MHPTRIIKGGQGIRFGDDFSIGGLNPAISQPLSTNGTTFLGDFLQALLNYTHLRAPFTNPEMFLQRRSCQHEV